MYTVKYLGSVRFFSVERNKKKISKNALNLSNVTVQTFILLQKKKSISNEHCSFELPFH